MSVASVTTSLSKLQAGRSKSLHRWHGEFRNHPTKVLSGHGNRMLALSREAEK